MLAAFAHYETYQIPDIDEFNSEIRAHHRYLNALHEYLTQFTLEPDNNAVYSVTPGDSPENLRIHIAPLHVGPMMDEYLNQRKESIILTSATLQTQGNFDHLKERLYADDYETLAWGRLLTTGVLPWSMFPMTFPSPASGKWLSKDGRARYYRVGPPHLTVA